MDGVVTLSRKETAKPLPGKAKPTVQATAKNPVEAPKPPKEGVDLTFRDLSWFAEKVERGRKGPYVEIITITPAIARRLLEMNADNRAVSQKTVARLAHDIEVNQWVLNGETIIISEDGWLNDGQNRLYAVIRADKPIQSAVIFGVKRNSRLTVDMGTSRTVGQFLGMQRMSNDPNHIASMARLHLVWKSGNSTLPRGTFTKPDILAEAERFLPAFSSAWSRWNGSTFAKNINGRSFLCVGYVIIAAHARRLEDVDLFFDKLTQGNNLEPESAILWLRNRLLGFVPGARTTGGTSETKLEILLRYWNAYISNVSLDRHLPLRGTYPDIKSE